MKSGPARPARAAPAPGHVTGRPSPDLGWHLLGSLFNAGTVFLPSLFRLPVSSLRGRPRGFHFRA